MRRRIGLALLAGVAACCLAPQELPSATASSPVASRLLVTGREYSLTLSRARIAPGRAIVQFHNAGEDPHDLKLQRVGGTRTFGEDQTLPGGLAQFDVNLWRGRHYVLYCSLADHRALGMEAHLTVKGHRRRNGRPGHATP
jgi:plastocyanin